MKTNKLAARLATAALLTAIATNAAAEQSGWFLGVQSDTKNLTNCSTDIDTSSSPYYDYANYNSNPQISILGGYKKFFSPKLGARFYGILNYSHANTKINGADDYKGNSFSLDANADFLFDFVSSESLDFGGFVGIELGYGNSGWERVANYYSSYEYKGTGYSFEGGANVGIRVNFGQRHGLELVNYLGYVVSRSKYDYFYYAYSSSPTYNPSSHTTKTFHQQIRLRYILSF